MEFTPFQKIPRLSRQCVVTEKLDGTNASIYIGDDGEFLVGSRQRWITPESDNYGFARWAHEHREELMLLGPGHHFGEWWGAGIQRGYGVPDKRFWLFNTHRWANALMRPACCGVVPVLFEGEFDSVAVERALRRLSDNGSAAAPGFLDPEGVVIYHVASGALFKKTIKGDEEGKHADAHVKKERPVRPPKDPSKGGRRVQQLPFAGEDRRRPPAEREEKQP